MFNHAKQNVQTFNNSQFGEIRIALNENQEPLFCLNDVCKALDLKNPRDVKSRLSPRGVAIADTLTQGGVQSMTYINEANLYKCIFQSRKTDAEAFQDWVCEEVLPSIRKSGGYLATKSDDTPEEIMARALTIAQVTLAKREERLKQLEADNAMQAETIESQSRELQKAAPKVQYVDEVLQSVNTYTATQIAKEVGMVSVKKVNIGGTFLQTRKKMSTFAMSYFQKRLDGSRTNAFRHFLCLDGQHITVSYPLDMA
ncbi:MAG: phage antirepressor KilAC domain-containing protein [Bacteroidales bacterium]|nr:phage antirepressor KilAC domain-containing protein [Bacteroidales bacterium]MCM1148152.1 phage antirepressor KilAC domain-containing protein [Bacteroidales bacterium]MCM1207121.1 phage antirepressor KilAC domain-containing protein [Bacillota bacterium]MCM1510873.1 phage antirepressor KilAC domain-containing protein [Clostridium sp.]